MIIHVISPTDTIQALSQKYNTTAEEISAVNHWLAEQTAIPGESIVIPAKYADHTVCPGESIYNICCQYGIEPDSLTKANKGIDMYSMKPGMKIQIPLQTQSSTQSIVNAFVEPSDHKAVIDSIKSTAETLSYISVFSYNVNPDGTLQEPDDHAILEAAKTYGVKPIMVISNLSKGVFDSQTAHRILTDMKIQDQLIGNIFNTLEKKHYCGLMIDFEKLPPGDGEFYNYFILNLRNRLLPGNSVLAVAAPLSMPDPYHPGFLSAYHYHFLQSVADFMVILTNEWGWAGSPPMPVMPLGEVEKNLLWLCSGVPKNKVVLNLPLYGFDWIIPQTAKTPFGTAISHKQAMDMVRRTGTHIHYETTSHAPYFHYLDENNKLHIVWFEDIRSLCEKFNFINRHALGGVSLWSLGRPFPQLTHGLANSFQVAKTPK